MEKEIETVVCIPSKWRSEEDFKATLAQTNQFIVVGNTIIEKLTNNVYEYELYPYDAELWKSFMHTGKFSEKDLAEIDQHSTTLYLISNTGNTRTLEQLTNIMSDLLKLGGVAIKIESSGAAHTLKSWFDIIIQKKPASLIEAFVTIFVDEGIYYSCGMHHLGYPDIKLISEESEIISSTLINEFLIDLLENSSEIKGNKLLRGNYKIQKEVCPIFPEDDLFYNPFGVFNLSKS
jgi:hypothetical protein